MTISTLSVGASVTPTVIKTYISHYTNRKPRHQKPTAHISYDEGLHLIRSFLSFASYRTVEDLQSFTAQWVPHPRWVKVDSVTIPVEQISRAANVLMEQLGPRGIDKIGGSKWWQWRLRGEELKADWIEMRAHHNERQRLKEKCKRAMLYVHGGAYFFGSVDEHRYQIQRHARKLKARVLAPRYRLAPQFPFPCGLHDCLAAYLYLLTVQDPTEIILAGDSAGGGMVVSMMCILRDRGLPLPAGAILISPWVDLTHSFPSLAGDGSFDYIPANGFMQKPSPSWPPPNDDETLAIAKAAVGETATASLPHKTSRRERKSIEIEAVQGFAVVESTADADLDEAGRLNPNNLAHPGDPDSEVRGGNTIPSPGHNVSIELDGVLIKLKDQIQMYTTNHLISHPLVSPVLQPSLGGLPPMLILTGGGELLRDEQIFLAHKAANPSDPKYQLGEAYKAEYDSDGKLAEKWQNRPTPVQLQVWDDLCHVAPTLSFTRPAKFMYRSVAQFGAWALARAQGVGVEIVDDDDISVISSGSDTDTDSEVEWASTDSLAAAKKASRARSTGPATNGAEMGPRIRTGSMDQIGKAGDPIPPFKNHMIRQRVDRHGIIFPLGAEKDLPALQMGRDEVGVIKPGPVRKWMEAKMEWDGKFARQKRMVQKQRVKDMASGIEFGHGERPPPSALAGRRRDGIGGSVKRGKKSMGLAMWSGWGSKHDKSTMRREEEAEKEGDLERRKSRIGNGARRESAGVRVEEMVLGRRISNAGKDTQLTDVERLGVGAAEKNRTRSRSRRRTVTVVDRGQVEGLGGAEDDSGPATRNGGHLSQCSEGTNGLQQQDGAQEVGGDSTYLSPLFIPKFKSHLGHLKSDSRGSAGDAVSVNTGYSTMDGDVDGDNVSTVAVFAAPGVMAENRERDGAKGSMFDNEDGLRSKSTSVYGGAGGADTPGSRRSVERLFSHQVMPEGEEQGERAARMQAMRSPSSVAIVRAGGVVGVVGDASGSVDGTSEAKEVEAFNEKESGRPKMYDRADSEYQTAMERI